MNTIILGQREHWGSDSLFGLQPEDARHHVYVIGKTGSGKTTLLRNMIIQHIAAGHGVGPITVCEPACGAGAMILSFAQACPPEVRRRLRVTAIDISRTACHMTFINTSLWGIPTRVIHGNSLSQECWAAWSNIHYIAPWLPLALRLQTPEAMEQGQPPKPAEIERLKAALVQPELF